ncbi:MAG: DUF4350 domain-containing protein [Gammaproteobacteria bacterium]
MKERLITLLCALGALALFSVMFLKREGTLGDRLGVPSPVTSERRGNGYHAAMTWLENEGIRSVSLRERYDTLARRDDLTPAGNLLIVTLPARAGFKTAEFLPLDRWVRAGNTLLVMAALSDNPEWSAESGGYAWSEATLLTGLEFETLKNRDRRLARRMHPTTAAEAEDDNDKNDVPYRAFGEPQRTVIVPNRSHAYFDGVTSVIALSDYPRHGWAVKVPYQGFVLALAHEEENREGAFWTRPLGKGRIVVSGFGSLFTNRAIGLGDNAKLLANIVGVNVGERGTVLFDDAHQGVGASYDPQKFYKDRRLYTTLGVLGALWFVWVLGSTRLRLPSSRDPRPREAELIRAAGGFLSRAVPGHAGARQLIENFFHRVSLRAGLPREGPVPWQLLERNTRIAAADLAQLHRWHEDAYARRRVPLRPLHNLILRLDRQMAT